MTKISVEPSSLAKLIDFATVTAILGAIVYWIGWFFSLQYFSYFGAPWFVDTLDSHAVVSNAYIVSTAFVALLLAFSVSYAKDKQVYAWLNLAGLCCLIFAGTIPLFPSLEDRLIPGVTAFVGGAGALSFAASLIAHNARPPFASLKNYLEPAYLICIILLIAAPHEFARGFAMLHSQPGGQSLPLVSLAETDQKWRLLAVDGDNALLVRIGKSRKENLFRYAPLSELEMVEPGVSL